MYLYFRLFGKEKRGMSERRNGSVCIRECVVASEETGTEKMKRERGRQEEIVSREESFSRGCRLFSDRAPSEGDQRRCKNSTPLPLPGSLTTNGEGNYVLKVIRIPPYALGSCVERYTERPATVFITTTLRRIVERASQISARLNELPEKRTDSQSFLSRISRSLFFSNPNNNL